MTNCLRAILDFALSSQPHDMYVRTQQRCMHACMTRLIQSKCALTGLEKQLRRSIEVVVT